MIPFLLLLASNLHANGNANDNMPKQTILPNQQRLLQVASAHATLACFYRLGLRGAKFDKATAEIRREAGISDIEFVDNVSLSLGRELAQALGNKCNPDTNAVNRTLDAFFARNNIVYSPLIKLEERARNSGDEYRDLILICSVMRLSGSYQEIEYWINLEPGKEFIMEGREDQYEQQRLGNVSIKQIAGILSITTDSHVPYTGVYRSVVSINRANGDYEKEIISPDGDVTSRVGKCYKRVKGGGASTF